MVELNEIHNAENLLLQEADRICRENNISYFLHAGTLLGAVRHQDFIPWDDDADIVFTRKEYERFMKAAAHSLQAEFELVDVMREPHFFDMISKINYLPSQLQNANEETQYYGEQHNHVSLDLYILDTAFNNNFLFSVQLFFLKMIYGMMMSKRHEDSSEKHHGIQYLQVKCLTFLGHFISLPRLRKWYSRIAQAAPEQSRFYFVSNATLPTFSARFPKPCFGAKAKGSFHHSIYPIPCGFDEILRIRYGNYMELPQEEERQAIHLVAGQVEVLYPNSMS